MVEPFTTGKPLTVSRNPNLEVREAETPLRVRLCVGSAEDRCSLEDASRNPRWLHLPVKNSSVSVNRTTGAVT